MKKTTVYLIRHGQSESNLAKVFAGQMNVNLSELGHAQAERTSEYLSKIPVDVIWSSDLNRAYQTAQHTAEKKGLEIHTSPKLREIFAGEWEGKPSAELKADPASGYQTWLYNIGAVQTPGGESVMEVQARFVPEVERIMRENEGKTIFIFCHATPIRLLRAAWEGVSAEEIKDIPRVANSSVTQGEFDGEKFRIVGYSYADFLGDMKVEPTRIGVKEGAK